jgi:hypothetical protein
VEAWPVEEFEEHKEDVAAAALELLRHPAAWRHRRVETITVLSHEEVRRAVSLDFTVPADHRELLIVSAAGECVVPLATLAKRPLVHFDLRNEEGHSVPLLTADQNRLVGRELLYVALDEDLNRDDAGEPVSAAVEQAAGPLIEQVLGAGAPAEALDRLEDEHGVALVDFREAVELLERSFVLWAVVRGLDRRRVLKFAYDEPFSLRAGFTHYYDAPGATEAASYHLEIAVPAELRARRTTLEDIATDQVLVVGERDTDRPAIYYAADPARPPAEPAVLVSYGAERGRFLVPAALVATVITLLLVLPLAFADLEALAAESGPAIGIVLSTSAVFSALVLRTDEHQLLRLVLLRYRLCLVASTLATLLAAAVLGFRADTWLLYAAWALAAAVSAAAAGILVLGVARSPASRSRPGTPEP